MSTEPSIRIARDVYNAQMIALNNCRSKRGILAARVVKLLGDVERVARQRDELAAECLMWEEQYNDLSRELQRKEEHIEYWRKDSKRAREDLQRMRQECDQLRGELTCMRAPNEPGVPLPRGYLAGYRAWQEAIESEEL